MPYITRQAKSGLLASYLLKQLFTACLFLGGTLPSGTAIQSFLLEVLLKKTFHKKVLAAAIIGGIVFLEAFYAGPVSEHPRILSVF